MTRSLHLALLFFVVLVLAACSADTLEPVGSIPNAEGGALLVEATRAALRVISDRRTATIQAATMSAGSTRESEDRSTTATAQFLKVREETQNLNATAHAQGVLMVQTLQAATETSEARHVAATETGVMRAMERSGSRTAEAAQATGTADSATATRSAQEIAQALERQEATATAEALDIRRAQAQTDAARAQSWSEFFDTVLKLILGVGSLALVGMLIVQIARYLDAMALRQKLVETRAGTVLIVAGRNGYSAEIIKPTPNLLEQEPEDEFEVSQLPAVTQEADDILKVTTTRGETFIAKTDPEEELKEQRRKLAMRLLRESMRYYSDLRQDSRLANRIPGHRNLNWSGDTWSRAVDSLRAYLIVKEGRGGGTFCGAEFPTLMQLYAAMGERRIAPVVKLPSPTAQDVLNVA